MSTFSSIRNRVPNSDSANSTNPDSDSKFSNHIGHSGKELEAVNHVHLLDQSEKEHQQDHQHRSLVSVVASPVLYLRDFLYSLADIFSHLPIIHQIMSLCSGRPRTNSTARANGPSHSKAIGYQGAVNGLGKLNSWADIPVICNDVLNIALRAPLPSTVAWTTDINQPVILRMGPDNASMQPMTVHELFSQVVRRAPNQLALHCRRDDGLKTWTYLQYYKDTCRAAKSLIKIGLQPSRSVAILGFNSPEWFIANEAGIFAGGVSVGIYATNNPEACAWVIEDSHAQVVVVENEQQLNKILKVIEGFKQTSLLAIVVYSGNAVKLPANAPANLPPIYTWSQFMEYGSDIQDSVLISRLEVQVPNKCCELIYTSGTTGNAKGVMLSHDNLTWTAFNLQRFAHLDFACQRIVSYLPLSHVAAQIIDLHSAMATAGTTYFARPDALRGTLLNTLQEAKPTIFFGVPRVWEKFQERVELVVKDMKGIRRKLFDWARSVGFRDGTLMMEKTGNVSTSHKIANLLVYRKLRRQFGFSQCKMCFTAAAPIMKSTLEFFLSLNIPVLEVFGMSENSGPHTVSMPDHFRIGACGVDMPGVRSCLKNVDEEGNGELCCDGRNVFMGYNNMPDKTQEAFDEQNLLRTGDLAKIDSQRFVHITGRIKELLITAGGENIPPVPIEERIKLALPVLGGVMLIGDQRKYLAVLLAIRTEVDPDTLLPMNKLSIPGKNFLAERCGIKAETLEECLEAPATSLYEAVKVKEALRAEVQRAIDQCNEKSTSRAQKVQKFVFLPRDFSIAGGELGPTLKLRRPIVIKMYKDLIEKMYAEPPPAGAGAD